MRNSDPVIFWPGAQYDRDIRQMMENNYQDCISNLQTQWQQADWDERTWLGDPQIWGALYPTNITQRRKMFNFNITHSTIMIATGMQRQKRKSTIAIPVLSPVQKTADQLTKCLYHVHKNQGYDIYSDLYERGMLVQGMGLISVFPDYGSDPVSPDIKMRYVDFKSIIIDPFFRNKDLSDCRFIWTRQYFDKEEAKKFYPKHAEAIDETPVGGAPKDDKFYYMPENYGLNVTKLCAFDEYWYLSQREATYAVDKLTEETQELYGDEEDIRIVMKTYGERLKIVKKPKQTIKRCILVNGRVLVDEMRPYHSDRYSYAAGFGNFNPDTPYFGYKFKGMVRDLRDSQFLFNMRKGADLDILSSQQQGIKMKQGALIDPDDSLNKGNGRVLILNKKSNMDDVQPMEIIPPSPVMLQMEDMLKNIHREISGINETAAGMSTDEKAGIISMLRHMASNVSTQKYLDNLDLVQTQVGEIIVEMIQNFWSYGKIKSIIGEEPTPEFDNKAFFKYGAKVVRGTLTETQQQEELAQIVEINQLFGNIIPMDEVVDRMTIQNKDDILKKIRDKQQSEQEQQQQMFQLQMEQMQIDNQTKLAYSHSQESLGNERIAKIQTDQAIALDKLRRANTEDTTALLNLIKTLKELENMDLSQLQSKIQILKDLQPENQLVSGQNANLNL